MTQTTDSIKDLRTRFRQLLRAQVAEHKTTAQELHKGLAKLIDDAEPANGLREALATAKADAEKVASALERIEAEHFRGER